VTDSPVSADSRWLVFLTAITVVFDSLDNQLLGVVIPARDQTVGAAESHCIVAASF